MESSSNKLYTMQGKDLNSSNSYCTRRPDLTTPRKLTKMTGCLEIIVGEDFGRAKSSQDSQHITRSSDIFNRPGSVSMGYVPPRSDSSLNRRVNTPTKQISLQAVRRKEDSAEPFVDQVNWQSLGLKNNNRKIWELGINDAGIEPSNTLKHREVFQLEPVDDTSKQATQISLLKPNSFEKENTSNMEHLPDINIMKVNQDRELRSDDKAQDDNNSSDDEDDDSDSSDEEEEKLKAPNELLMEFVDCLMRNEFQTASKLCKMILLYEPENPEAINFQPLIEEKLALDAEVEKESTDEGDEDNDDGDSGSCDDDDEDDDSDEDSSDDDSSNSEDDDEGDSASSNSNNNNILFGINPRSCSH